MRGMRGRGGMGGMGPFGYMCGGRGRWRHGGRGRGHGCRRGKWRNKECSAEFVKEVVSLDQALPSQTLLKSWQLKNNGTSSWPAGTKLVYRRGDLPSVDNEFEVPSNVQVGHTVDVSAVVRTPPTPGRYHAVFRLAGANKNWFGPKLRCDVTVVAAPEVASAPEASPEALASPSAPSQEAAPSSPDETTSSRYATQLNVLKAMGWDNEELNVYLLSQNNGDVQRVCTWLLEQMKE